LQSDEPIAVSRDLIAQLLDPCDQRTIMQREGVEILVARDELPERLRR